MIRFPPQGSGGAGGLTAAQRTTFIDILNTRGISASVADTDSELIAKTAQIPTHQTAVPHTLVIPQLPTHTVTAEVAAI